MKRSVLLLIFLYSTLSVSTAKEPVPSGPAQKVVSCSLEGFPNAVRNQLEKDLVSWKVQQSDDLSRNAHERWQAEKPLRCPGIAVGKFEGEASAYAVLLVPRKRLTAGYKFLVFGPLGIQVPYGKRVVDESRDHGAENLFIRATKIGKFFNESSKAKFLVAAPEAILMLDAGESEYEVDLYFWTNATYEHQPVDY